MITKNRCNEEMLDASVAEVISELVSNPKFSGFNPQQNKYGSRY